MLRSAICDGEDQSIVATVAVSPQKLAEAAGFLAPEDRTFVTVVGGKIGKEYRCACLVRACIGETRRGGGIH